MFTIISYSQREIEQLQEEIAKLKQSPDYQHVEIQTDEEWVDKNEDYSHRWPALVSSIKALHETIQQQTEQLEDLNEENATLLCQLASQTELNKQK